VTRQEKAAAKRARRAARNERHPGAFSTVTSPRKPRGGGWWAPSRYEPAIENKAEAEARFAREAASGKARPMRLVSALLTALTIRSDVKHHRGGDR
jgi:hypothetical protein